MFRGVRDPPHCPQAPCSWEPWGDPPGNPRGTHLVTASWASWLGGGTRKHTEGTAASLLGPLSTFQWDGWAGPSSWHWSPLCTVTWDSQSSRGWS